MSNTTENYFNITYNEGVINFEGLFSNRPLKFVGLCFASVSMVIITLLSYGIIWFERFGSGD
jgi:hypothetical protein